MTTEGRCSIGFTEEMKGFLALGEAADYAAGFERGKKEDTSCMFHLTIRVDDVDAFVQDPDEEARATGYVDCPALGGRLAADPCWFNLLVDAVPGQPEVKNMRYRLFLTDPGGRRLTLSGHKVVKDDGIVHVWRDTTTLFTRMLEGHVPPADEPSAKVLACGILHIYPLDFARLVSTFSSDGPSLAARARAVERFTGLFLGQLWQIYGPKQG